MDELRMARYDIVNAAPKKLTDGELGPPMAEGVSDRLGLLMSKGTRLTGIESWARLMLKKAVPKKPGKIFLPDENSTKYKGVFKSYEEFVAPVLRVGYSQDKTALIGLDKLSLFFE